MADKNEQYQLDQQLIDAVSTCDAQRMLDLLVAGANPFTHFDTYNRSKERTPGQTLLHLLMLASYGKPVEEVRECTDILLHAGLDLEAKNGYGNRPLHETLVDGYCKRSGLIVALEAGASVKTLGRANMTAMHFTADHSDPTAAQLLSAAGAELSFESPRSEHEAPFTPYELAQKFYEMGVNNEPMLMYFEGRMKAPLPTPDPEQVKKQWGLDLQKRTESIHFLQQESDENRQKHKAIIEQQERAIARDLPSAFPPQNDPSGFVHEESDQQIRTLLANTHPLSCNLHLLQHKGMLSQLNQQNINRYYPN